MKSKAIVAAYRSYARDSGVRVSELQGVAVVYGEDQFKIDFRRGTVKLAGVFDLLEVPELRGWSNGPIPWLADLVQYERHHLVIGAGDPWGLGGRMLLPNERGIIKALPLLVALGAEEA